MSYVIMLLYYHILPEIESVFLENIYAGIDFQFLFKIMQLCIMTFFLYLFFEHCVDFSKKSVIIV